MTNIHPIEVESYRILEERVDLSHLAPGPRAVIARVVHASADLEYVTATCVDERAVDAGVAALRAGAPVIVDVEMVRVGLSVPSQCYLADVDVAPPGGTRAAAAMRAGAERHPVGAVVVVGCAPTALFEVVDLVEAGMFAPALVVGMPVGFVGAAQSKERLRKCDLASISNVGEKGGSAVAAAVVNALRRLVPDRDEGR